MVVTRYIGCDPNLYVGDVQIRDFKSCMKNQIKWNKPMYFVERDNNIEGLRLRPEPNPTKLFKERTKVMKSTTFVGALGDKNRESISFCEIWISLNRLETYCV